MPVFSGDNFGTAASNIEYSRIGGSIRGIGSSIIIQPGLSRATDNLDLDAGLALDRVQKILAIARLAHRLRCYSENLFGSVLLSKFLIRTYGIHGSLEFIA